VRELDVLVTCFPHSDQVTLFPMVRGHDLAEHLARTGLRAEFRTLPVGPVKCEVVICSEYQQDLDWFEAHLAGPLGRIDADRMFCMVDESLGGRPDFSLGYCAWFAARGGVLCHTVDANAERYEHWIGLGVDAHVVRPDPHGRRDHVLFDFPRSRNVDPASHFDPATLDVVRACVPGWRLVGSGEPDAPVRAVFDEWIDYGTAHTEYVSAAFSRAVAVLPGCAESLGLALAEAQVAGACVVSSEGQVRAEVLVPEAAVSYRTGDARSLAGALLEAGRRDHGLIRRQASERFDYAAVAARTRAAIGV
jgi:hypothetical protein